jgi:predicted nucleic acid-binding protein
MFSDCVMPTSADVEWAVDTSVVVAALDASHAAHQVCADACRHRRPALAGHAAFESFSVLTRLHGALSVDPISAVEALDLGFPQRCWLTPDDQARVLARLATLGISGGAVYDALVGEAARANGRSLMTRDLRASRTYELIGVATTFVGER